MATALKERDPIAELGIKLISSDNHVNEPRDLFIKRFPAHLKDKAPRVVDGTDGGEGWSMMGETPKRTYGLEAMAGFDKSEYRVSGLRYENLRPGNYDGYEHLKDMDIDGVAAEILFPPQRTMSHFLGDDDEDFVLAGVEAYNNFLFEEFCAPDPKRLVGIAMAAWFDQPEDLHGLGARLEQGLALLEAGLPL